MFKTMTLFYIHRMHNKYNVGIWSNAKMTDIPNIIDVWKPIGIFFTLDNAKLFKSVLTRKSRDND